MLNYSPFVQQENWTFEQPRSQAVDYQYIAFISISKYDISMTKFIFFHTC